jgi:hypothetical protein
MISDIAADLVASQLGANSVAQQPSTIKTNYDFSLADISRFEQAYYRVNDAAQNGPTPTRAAVETPIQPTSIMDSPALRAIFAPIERLNGDATTLAREAQTLAMTNNGNLSPGQMVMLTMRCHEFMFRCELTSNIATRSSDGVQQLFRQQS